MVSEMELSMEDSQALGIIAGQLQIEKYSSHK